MEYCSGRGEPDGGHCCWVDGQVCPFYEKGTVPGRVHVCGLMRMLGSWEAVHDSPGYRNRVKPVWEAAGIPDCGDWQPEENTCCRKAR
jgi:hypothetical protein